MTAKTRTTDSDAPDTAAPDAAGITLRRVAEDDLRGFLEPVVRAFGSDFNENEFGAERPLMEAERFVSAFDGERRVGGAGSFAMRMRVPGTSEPVRVSGITAVGVQPDSTRRGILRQMMGWLIEDATARGESMAILLASEAAIYQRFGFGSATQSCFIETEQARLVFRDPLPPRDDARFRIVDRDEAATIFPAIYDAANADVPGALERVDLRWRNLVLSDEEWARRGRGPTNLVVLEMAGEPRGYAIYRSGGEWSPRGPMGATNVTEVVALDPEAQGRLWRWLATRDLSVTLAVFRGPVPHPLQMLVQEPRRLGVTVTDGLWLRMLDLPTALAARRYAHEGTLVLDVADPMIEGNAGRWQLTVRADGSASVVRTSAAPDLALGVATLASTYLGTFRFTDLTTVGLVHELRPGAALAATTLFTPSRTPYSNTFF